VTLLTSAFAEGSIRGVVDPACSCPCNSGIGAVISGTPRRASPFAPGQASVAELNVGRSLRTSCRRPPARRPHRLAVYMGCCADRRQGHVTCATHDGRPLLASTQLKRKRRLAPIMSRSDARPEGEGSLELRSCSSSAAGALRTVTPAPALGRNGARGALLSARSGCPRLTIGGRAAR
jgi:hypothetical protein